MKGGKERRREEEEEEEKRKKEESSQGMELWIFGMELHGFFKSFEWFSMQLYSYLLYPNLGFVRISS